MLRMLPLLGWVLIPDCWARRGSDAVHGYTGGSLSVSCQYEKHFRDNTKFWCKQRQYVSTCSQSSIIKSDSDKKVEKGRVSIEDKKKDMYFIVTMDNLQLDDSGTYQCGIEQITTLDIGHNIKVTVSPANNEFNFIAPTALHPEEGSTATKEPPSGSSAGPAPSIKSEGPSSPSTVSLLYVPFLISICLKTPIFLCMVFAIIWMNRRSRQHSEEEKAD